MISGKRRLLYGNNVSVTSEFNYSQIPGVRYWLQSKDDSFVTYDGGLIISEQTDRVLGLRMIATGDVTFFPAPTLFANEGASLFDPTQYLRSVDLATMPSDDTNGWVIYVTLPAPAVDGEWMWTQGYSFLGGTHMGMKAIAMGGGDFRLAFDHRAGGGTPNVIRGNTNINTGGTFAFEVQSSGTGWSMRVNNAAETMTVVSGLNNGDWFGDLLAVDNLSINRYPNSISDELGMVQAFGLMLIGEGSIQPSTRTLIYEKIAEEYPEIGL